MAEKSAESQEKSHSLRVTREKEIAIESINQDFEGEKNLYELYQLLLHIDRRSNPHLYTS